MPPCQIHAPASHSHPRTHEDADEQAAADAEVQAATRADADATALVEHSDELLADIDEALGEWAATSEAAQTFIDGYVCKGGE